MTLPIYFTQKGNFKDFRSRDLFLLLFRTNVEADKRLNKGERKVLFYLADRIRFKPYLQNVCLNEASTELKLNNNEYIVRCLRRASRFGYLVIENLTYSQKQRIYYLVPIPEEWDKSQLIAKLEAMS